MRERQRPVERTCCICRSKGEKRNLVRLVSKGGSLVVDYDQRLPGRGAYVHPTMECLSRMGQPGRWDRALRIAGASLQAPQVARVVEELMARAGRSLDPKQSGSIEVGKRKGM